MLTIKWTAVGLALALCGCAHPPQLGTSLNQLRSEQTLDPNAWHSNLHFLPEGNGQRTQVSMEIYQRNGVTQQQ
ncbi:hypothetical protein BS333_10710 [Vibrio azureus]|uniref:Uncharacterized protein n=1 Tax=Vibrio azureus NBRC 104587 TaxID=1219077 RepID=U3A338_9VIBR|nr:hypothetical protein [Vibrio azureus]AUI86827.1 hypothetical protein BS333_10710 [Vibrio azureus]GAD74396.1 hypothetical protein VAZ01S_010_00490 [Vibrio azureus NBRC 104587]